MIPKKKIEKLGVKIGTKEEAFWTAMRDRSKGEVETNEKMLKFSKAILEMCEEKIKKCPKIMPEEGKKSTPSGVG